MQRVINASQTMTTPSSKSEKICCPPFMPEKWDGVEIQWKNKRFIKDRVFTFFYIPLNFGVVMERVMKTIESAGKHIPDYLCLSEHTSLWNMNVYVAVDAEIKGAENVFISGSFLCKVYEGDFKETGVWCKDFELYASGKKRRIEKWYMWYTTCPACAKKYGKNYVVIIAKTQDL